MFHTFVVRLTPSHGSVISPFVVEALHLGINMCIKISMVIYFPKLCEASIHILQANTIKNL